MAKACGTRKNVPVGEVPVGEVPVGEIPVGETCYVLLCKLHIFSCEHIIAIYSRKCIIFLNLKKRPYRKD